MHVYVGEDRIGQWCMLRVGKTDHTFLQNRVGLVKNVCKNKWDQLRKSLQDYQLLLDLVGKVFTGEGGTDQKFL